MLVQVTAASLTGTLGSSSQRAGEALLRLGLAHVIARDVRAPGERRCGIAAVLAHDSRTAAVALPHP